LPEAPRHQPHDKCRHFPAVEGRQLVLGPDARDGPLKVYHDMTVSRWVLASSEQDNIAIEAGRRIWIQVVKGDVTVNGQAVTTSDALAIWDESALTIEASSAAEVLLFDLPPV
ncbi:MAG TPA: pirin family protein, partial [Pantoea sp.]|nr:pirin family protein [Pantoea sp.]